MCIRDSGEGSRLFGFMKELNTKAIPTERTDYLPEWPGFQGVFGLHMRAASRACHVELDAALENEFRDSPNPHIILADRIVRAIQGLDAHRAEFDVLFIYIPQRWEPGYVGGPNEDFDLHDHIKACLLYTSRCV